MGKCNCSTHENDDGFDAKAAYQRLAYKHARLSDILVRYMSEAGLERSLRNDNAMAMARETTIHEGEPTSDFGHCCIITPAYCTGVLIHPRIVLTAAHCNFAANTRVGLNCTRLSDPLLEERNVQRVRPHPLSASWPAHDITVLILQTDATTQPVAIATTEEIDQATRTTLVGFGVTEFGQWGEKRMVEVDIHRHADINAAEAMYMFESDFEFTAGGPGGDTCTGDSGGPAYISSADGSKKLAALTSRGFGPLGNCGEGGIYTRVDKHLDFVRQVAADNGIDLV